MRRMENSHSWAAKHTCGHLSSAHKRRVCAGSWGDATLWDSQTNSRKSEGKLSLWCWRTDARSFITKMFQLYIFPVVHWRLLLFFLHCQCQIEEKKGRGTKKNHVFSRLQFLPIKCYSHIQNIIYPAIKVGIFSPIKAKILRIFRLVTSSEPLLQCTVLQYYKQILFRWLLKIWIKLFQMWKPLRLENSIPRQYWKDHRALE